MKQALVSRWNHNLHDITNNQVLRVNWTMGNSCTFKCSYCPNHLNDGSIRWLPLDQMKKIVDDLIDVYTTKYGKKIFIFELTGGEPTVYPDIDDFAVYLKSKGIYVQLCTNGSRTVRWWNDFAENFQSITLSYHVEFTDVEHMVKVGNLVESKGVSACGLVLMDPQNFDKIKADLEYMRQYAKFNVNVRKVMDRGSKKQWLYRYTDEQLAYLDKNYFINPATPVVEFPNEMKYQTIWINNGEHKSINENTLFNLPENNFYGWDCYGGIDTLSLDVWGNILTGYCETMMHSPIGNWRKDDLKKLEWRDKPTVCKNNSCVCVHDIRSRKFQHE